MSQIECHIIDVLIEKLCDGNKATRKIESELRKVKSESYLLGQCQPNARKLRKQLPNA